MEKLAEIGLDYLQQIRLHVKTPQHGTPTPTCPTDKYFDSVAFWKEAYTKAEATQSRLSDRVYELEQRVETLKIKLKEDESSSRSPDPGKRKCGKETTVPDSQRKRKRLNTGLLGLGLSTEEELERLNEVYAGTDSSQACTYFGACTKRCGWWSSGRSLIIHIVVSSVMRHLSALQQNLQKKPSWAVIHSSIINLCNAVESTVPFLCDRSPSKSASRHTDPVFASGVIESSHMLMCQGLNKIMKSSEKAKCHGALVYQMASLFQKILYALEKGCNYKAESSIAIPRTKRDSTSSSARSVKKNLSSDSSDTSDLETIMDEQLHTLTRVLAGMLLTASKLASNDPNSLFEGYLYILLTRVGSVLSLLEFKAIVLSPDLRSTSDKLPVPGGILRAGVVEEKDGSSETHLVAREIESRHLIWLLEKAIALVHTTQMKSVAAQSMATDSGNKSTNKGNLLGLSKKKLQSTLLKAVFDEDDPFFSTSLKRPQRPVGEIAAHSNVSSETASEWFSREVWRLLGWDILEGIWKNQVEDHIE